VTQPSPARQSEGAKPNPDFFEADRAEVESTLETLLPPESEAPSVIHRAMRYSVFAGGKRIRPILCLEAARIFSDPPRGVLPVACALEFIHTYSLIHDDLPALDNDDLRRGRPTNHKVFGDAMAILAGDALLTRAFEVLGRAELSAERRASLVREIATAAGTVNGMVGGQVADVEAGGKPIDAAMLEYIHRSKTAALIRASAASGAIAGGAENADIERLRRFGENIGLAFQVVDDILDVEGSSATLGKTAGKDASQQKATYPALYGLEKSRETAHRFLQQAHAELAPFAARAQRLHELADYLVARRA
jgi:geranylgeranyl diphosphate synthase, type II